MRRAFTLLPTPAALGLCIVLLGLLSGCSQATEIGPVDIQPVAVAGPPADWEMSTRLMNRQSASSATLSSMSGGPEARFGGVSGSMYFNADNTEPFTGTVVMRADSLTSDDAELQGRLEAWLEPTAYPVVIFQSTGSSHGVGGFMVEGNLFVRDLMIPVTGNWRATQPVTRGDDLRNIAELSATITARVAGVPFAGDEIRLDLTLPVVGYTADFVKNMLESDGFDIADLTGPEPSYPSGAGDLSNVAWYLMLAGHTDRALEVFQMSLDQSASLNTYLRRSDGYVFDGQYDMAVGSYAALEKFNVGQPHGLELTKILGGGALNERKVAQINAALTGQ